MLGAAELFHCNGNKNVIELWSIFNKTKKVFFVYSAFLFQVEKQTAMASFWQEIWFKMTILATYRLYVKLHNKKNVKKRLIASLLILYMTYYRILSDNDSR